MPRRIGSPFKWGAPLALSAGFALAIVPLPLQPACAAGAVTLYNFCAETNCADGSGPKSDLLVDADGNIFGTTEESGAHNDGTVFEIAKTAHGYAAAPTILASFDGAHGANPEAGLIADSQGNLFGTTFGGGANDAGTVYEIVKTRHGYASTPTVLVSFGGESGGEGPEGVLLADVHGNLFGTTTAGGPDNDGAVFEIEKTKSGYAGTPTILASFTGPNGAVPLAGLIADAHGNLFGTTEDGGSPNKGTVFEIEKTRFGYANTPTILYSFCAQNNCTDGAYPKAALTFDSHGNLFGTTEEGGASNLGAVFEIAKTASGYANTATILASFDDTNGESPVARLLADPHGDLFGTTTIGGADNAGTVFEIQKNGDRYGAPSVLVGFDGAGGAVPFAGLTEHHGDLFGTTEDGGAHGDGTVFVIPGH
jgi:uncharacterized repeat protein (TIGR03803 family)